MLVQVVACKIEPHIKACLPGYRYYKSKLITVKEGTTGILTILWDAHSASAFRAALESVCDLLNASASCNSMPGLCLMGSVLVLVVAMSHN